jgi:hypothetical protein
MSCTWRAKSAMVSGERFNVCCTIVDGVSAMDSACRVRLSLYLIVARRRRKGKPPVSFRPISVGAKCLIIVFHQLIRCNYTPHENLPHRAVLRFGQPHVLSGHPMEKQLYSQTMKQGGFRPLTRIADPKQFMK